MGRVGEKLAGSHQEKQVSHRILEGWISTQAGWGSQRWEGRQAKGGRNRMQLYLIGAIRLETATEKEGKGRPIRSRGRRRMRSRSRGEEEKRRVDPPHKKFTCMRYNFSFLRLID